MLLKIVLSLAGLGISLIIHEQMHARVAFWLGDPTGKNENRFSWNPIHHIDPFMSVLLPLILLYSSKGRFTFGGAKPCPINPMNFKNPSLGYCLSAAAGPLSNYGLALVAFGLTVALHHAVPSALVFDDRLTPNGYFLVMFVILNVGLGSFNLLPFPPLDGSRLLRHFSPREVQKVIDLIEPYGFILLVAFLYFGKSTVIAPIYDLCSRAYWDTFGPDFYEAIKLSL
jgi:Zn-dependent protease